MESRKPSLIDKIFPAKERSEKKKKKKTVVTPIPQRKFSEPNDGVILTKEEIQKEEKRTSAIANPEDRYTNLLEDDNIEFEKDNNASRKKSVVFESTASRASIFTNDVLPSACNDLFNEINSAKKKCNEDHKNIIVNIKKINEEIQNQTEMSQKKIKEEIRKYTKEADKCLKEINVTYEKSEKIYKLVVAAGVKSKNLKKNKASLEKHRTTINSLWDKLSHILKITFSYLTLFGYHSTFLSQKQKTITIENNIKNIQSQQNTLANTTEQDSLIVIKENMIFIKKIQEDILRLTREMTTLENEIETSTLDDMKLKEFETKIHELDEKQTIAVYYKKYIDILVKILTMQEEKTSIMTSDTWFEEKTQSQQWVAMIKAINTANTEVNKLNDIISYPEDYNKYTFTDISNLEKYIYKQSDEFFINVPELKRITKDTIPLLSLHKGEKRRLSISQQLGIEKVASTEVSAIELCKLLDHKILIGSFWQDQTKAKPFGGKKAIKDGQKYRVPTGIYDMIELFKRYKKYGNHYEANEDTAISLLNTLISTAKKRLEQASCPTRFFKLRNRSTTEPFYQMLAKSNTNNLLQFKEKLDGWLERRKSGSSLESFKL